MSDIITAIEIDQNKKSIDAELNTAVTIFVKKRVKAKIKELKVTKEYTKDEIVLLIDELTKSYQTDNETLMFRNNHKSILEVTKQNYFILRKTIQELNELNEFSSEYEKNNIQRINNFSKYDELILSNLKNIGLYKIISKTRKTNIDAFIESIRNKSLTHIQYSEPELLSNLTNIYSITKNIDDIELYERYNMLTNIDMSNYLALIYLKQYSENIVDSNIINNLINQNNINQFTTKTVIDNKLFGLLLLSSMNDIVTNNSISFVSNNLVTCMKSMYDNTDTNEYIYSTRTIGELLIEIVNPKNKNIAKENRKQIYMTYDGTRPTTDEYYKWNGLQVFDIDLKEWNNGNIELLKQKIYEYLSDFNWFLWVCKSASGKGIHIYTKVTAPHHIYVNPKNNEYISKYWFKVNYLTKQSIIYDVIYRIHTDSRINLSFDKTNFYDPTNIFEIKFLDNSVSRITSGIRLTYDSMPLVNNYFLDLQIGFNLCQTIDGLDNEQIVKKILLRESKVIEKFKLNIDEELAVGENITEQKQSEIDLSKFVNLSLDTDDIKPLNVSINYNIRYNVCNTLAALFGKDGLSIAHLLLNSARHNNAGEINSFYSCALNNGKKPTKFGLDLLKKTGIVKSIEPELKEIVGSNFKLGIMKAINNSLANELIKTSIDLKPYEYLSDKKDILLGLTKATNVKPLSNDKINIILSPPGTGKCLGKDTGVLMFDGSIKMVQDITVGELLMGWDSKPRKVLTITTGVEELFKIIPNSGEPWVCNKSHILSLIESGKYDSKLGKIPNRYDIEDMNISKIKNLPKNHRKKLFRVPLNFDKKDVLISPYFLGLWLGDGSTNRCDIAVGDIDKDVTVPFLEAYAAKLGCKLTRYQDFRENHNVSTYNIVKHERGKEESKIQELMNHYSLLGNKHIPKDYLFNDRKTRLFLFAGLIDSDGGGEDCTYDYVTKLDRLKDDIVFLARSLGYNVNVKQKTVNDKKYWRLLISGDFSDLPVRLERKRFTRKINKNPLMSGFQIESIGLGNYYGFEIDGDKRFMLSDFTVTHNTELIKNLSRDGKRILLVLPYISVIKNKIETDVDIMKMFDCYYGAKDIKDIEYGINAVTTFDKFARANYEKLSKMFDYIFIDESHLLFTSSYRIEATSNVIKKIKNLFYISLNDPFAAKLCLLTGTETGETYFFGNVANIIKIGKPALDKTMEFIICGDILDSITRLADRAVTLINEGYRLLLPTNKGEIYSEKIIGMVEFLMNRPVKYGYYKRSNTDQEICRLINNDNTIGDYEIVFCSNYLSVGVDINDSKKFASIYLGNFSGYEIEQFNARIRKSGIKSVYCLQTENSDGTTNGLLLEEPNLLLHITEEDKVNFLDDKSISGAKQEFIAQYDPVLHKITTPGFSYFNGKIAFNLEEYELTTFESKYNDCMQHPVKVARELDKYGYKIKVSTEFDGLDINKQSELKSAGIESAKLEKLKKHQLLIGTFMDLISKNTFANEHGLEFNNIIEWIGKNSEIVVENREINGYVIIEFDVFATPTSVIVKSKEAFDTMYKSAKYLISKYSVTKAIDIINQYIVEPGILKQKKFKRAINLLKLIDSADANELTIPLTNIIEKVYSFVDKFEMSKDFRISYNTYKSVIDEWTNQYIDDLGIKINTAYGFQKIQDAIIEILNDIATKSMSKNGLSFNYNTLPNQDSSAVINRRSIDTIISTMFRINSDIIKHNKVRKTHILTEQTF